VIGLFSFLGSRGLVEPDEGRYAEIGREMAATGEWLVPHLNGFPHFQKPPLLYWATAVSIRVFGANEWAARLPSAFSALGVVLLIALIGERLFQRKTGLAAAFILLSTVGFFGLARLLTPDMTLTFWTTAAVACVVQYQFVGGRRAWAWLFFAALGCGFLTKGPMALIVPLSAAITAQTVLRRRGESRPLPWTLGLTLSFAIGLSWFVALSLWKGELFDYFWRYELVERFASASHGRSQPIWFFIPVILIALIPWVFWLPRLVQPAWRRLKERAAAPSGWLLLGWTLPPFLILSLSGSKLPTYILPLLPPIALALGHWLVRGSAVLPVWIPRTAVATLAVCLGATVAFPRFNDALKQQASLRDLIRPLATEPGLRTARIYAVEVRSHGLEFYLRRLVSATEQQSDIVLEPTSAERRRLISSDHFKSGAIEPKPGESPVFVLTRRGRAQKSFPLERWSRHGTAGDFILLKSRASRIPAFAETHPLR
ncbi:MAG: glycosyltransferase family 39 protein, partial [Chthoniobacteraceae bacterium]